VGVWWWGCVWAFVAVVCPCAAGPRGDHCCDAAGFRLLPLLVATVPVVECPRGDCVLPGAMAVCGSLCPGMLGHLCVPTPPLHTHTRTHAHTHTRTHAHTHTRTHAHTHTLLACLLPVQSFVCQTISLSLVTLFVFYKRPGGGQLQSLVPGVDDGLYSSFESKWYSVPGFYIVFTVRHLSRVHARKCAFGCVRRARGEGWVFTLAPPFVPPFASWAVLR
jgi:hypothetical protein